MNKDRLYNTNLRNTGYIDGNAVRALEPQRKERIKTGKDRKERTGCNKGKCPANECTICVLFNCSYMYLYSNVCNIP